jgi:outer membrane protein OmpA-like peptidoglycan-associated protein
MLVAALGMYNCVQAQFNSPDLAWGLSAGGAKGNNQPGDDWVMQYRGFLQSELFTPMLMGQLGLGYVPLSAHSVSTTWKGYSAETGILDLRLLFSPFSLPNLKPYVYAGFGISKDLSISGSDYLMMVPFGLGIQTMVSRGVLLFISGGYNLSLSDKLDNFNRTSTYLNDITNGKQDGFYGFAIGVAFTIGSGKDNAEEKQKKEIAEAEARRVKAEEDAWHAKELANAEARRIQDSTNASLAARNAQGMTEAEALRIKGMTDAEARRIRDSSNAAAEAVRVNNANIAEAQRIKDSTNAAALLAAQQKSSDTVIVLLKGTTVVLNGVNFEFNKATLTKDSERILWRAYNAMAANPNVRVVITGHTDNVGSQKANQTLSLKRAQAVKNWLVKKGIASKRMRTVGRGKNEPSSSNETVEGRAENRCIEFYVQ